jgi:hypothetical protein
MIILPLVAIPLVVSCKTKGPPNKRLSYMIILHDFDRNIVKRGPVIRG